MPTVLVAGATGYLGRYLVAELKQRGHTVRAIARNRARAEREGAWGSPALAGLVDEWAIGQVTDTEFTADVARGAQHIISALGVTRQKADPWEIDNLGNLHVLNSALAHGAGSFTYVNVLGGAENPARLTRAKTTFAQTLQAAPIRSRVINPSGYFSDMMEILGLARRGVVPVFHPDGKITPIHGADLAEFCVDRLEEATAGTWDVGGPDTYTWRELAQTAFAALGKRPRVPTVPPAVVTPLLRVLGLFTPRLADTARFAMWGMLHEYDAPAFGTHHLADFYAEQVRRTAR